MTTPPHDLAVFAGGDGARIGGGKPLRLLAGQPLLAFPLAALAGDAARIAIVARDLAAAWAMAEAVASALGPDAARLEAWADADGLAGPVAALIGAARRATAPFILTVPADTPFLPPDLAARLMTGSLGSPAAIAADARWHPTVALYETSSLVELVPRRSLMATIEPLGPRPVQFPSDNLLNVNTAEDLALAEARLAAEALTRDSRR